MSNFYPASFTSLRSRSEIKASPLSSHTRADLSGSSTSLVFSPVPEFRIKPDIIDLINTPAAFRLTSTPYSFNLLPTVEIFQKNEETKPIVSSEPIPFFQKPFEDFESESEDTRLPEGSVPSSQETLKFCANRFPTFEEIKFKAVDLIDFITLNSKRISARETFVCEQCGKVLKSASAKGGHMTKSHPKESKKYRQRQLITEFRKLERGRKRFLSGLKQ